MRYLDVSVSITVRVPVNEDSGDSLIAQAEDVLQAIAIVYPGAEVVDSGVTRYEVHIRPLGR